MASNASTLAQRLKAWRAQFSTHKPAAKVAGPGIQALNPPEPEGLLRNLDPPRPGDQINLLRRERSSGDLPVLVVYVGDPVLSATVSATWNGIQGVIPTVVFPASTLPANKKIIIPHNQLTVSKTNVLVWHLAIQGAPENSDPYTLTVDLDVPNNGSALDPIDYPAAVLDGVTLEYLTDNNGLKVTIPKWSDIARGDRVVVYLIKKSDLVTAADLIVADLDIDDPSDPVEATISLAQFQQVTEGMVVVAYRVYDRAGNNVLDSDTFRVPFPVVLSPLPVFVPDDVLTLVTFTQGATITRLDIQAGVVIRVPKHEDWKLGDRADLYWGAATAPAYSVDAPGEVFDIRVPWQPILDEGEGTDIELRVKICRRNTQIGVESAVLEVAVDLSAPGPAPDPNKPGPVNDALPVAVVKGANHAGNPANNNKLVAADVNQPATVEVVLTAGFAVDETLLFYWEGNDTPVANVSLASGVAVGAIVTGTVAWVNIEAGAYGPAVKVYYKVVKTAALDGQYQQSIDTQVDAQIAGISDLEVLTVPGKQTIVMPTTPPYDVYVIDCGDEPWNGIKVFIPPAEGRFPVGSVATVTFEAFDGYEPSSGSAGEEEYPPYTMNETDINRGVEFTIPNTVLVAAVHLKRAEVKYNITTPLGKQGDSDVINLYIRRTYGNGQPCPPAP